MSNPAKGSEDVQRAIAEHAAMSEFVRNLDEAVGIWKTSEPSARIHRIRSFLQKHVTEHFALEDEKVFPALLDTCADATTSRTIRGLQLDHKQIHQEASQLKELLRKAEGNGELQLMAEVESSFRVLLGRLQRHAAVEDKLFAALAAQKR